MINNKELNNNKPISQELSSAVKSFRKINRVKFLYINNELLLKAFPSDTIASVMGGFDITSDNKIELNAFLPLFDQITEHCNKRIRNLKRIKCEPKGIHLPKNANIPLELVLKIVNGGILFEKLPCDVQEQLVLENLTKDDCIKPQEGDKLDWLNFMIPDGKIFPYTILTGGELNRIGFPVGLYTKGNEDVSYKSIKNIFYKDPISGKVVKGIYFEVYEGPGPLGEGGINGVIVESNKPVIIINTDKSEAYFLNVNESTKGLGGIDLLPEKLQVVG